MADNNSGFDRPLESFALHAHTQNGRQSGGGGVFHTTEQQQQHFDNNSGQQHNWCQQQQQLSLSCPMHGQQLHPPSCTCDTHYENNNNHDNDYDSPSPSTSSNEANNYQQPVHKRQQSYDHEHGELKPDSIRRSTSSPAKRGVLRFAPWQLDALRARFESLVYLMPEERRRLADQLSLSEEQVRVWFQNRRNEIRRRNRELRVSDDVSDDRNAHNRERRKRSRATKDTNTTNTNTHALSNVLDTVVYCTAPSLDQQSYKSDLLHVGEYNAQWHDDMMN